MRVMVLVKATEDSEKGFVFRPESAEMLWIGEWGGKEDRVFLHPEAENGDCYCLGQSLAEG